MSALIRVPLKTYGIFTKMCRYVLTCVLLIVIFSSTGQSGGDSLLTPEELRWLNENKSRIVLAVETGYPPYVFLDSKGKPSGLAHDYLLQLESKLGVNFSQKQLSTLDEIFSKVRIGEVQIVNAVTKTPARSEFLSFTEPFITVPNVILVRKERSGEMHEKDLAGLKVSLVKNYAITEYLSKAETNIVADSVPNDLTAILHVSFGQSDAAVIDLATASWLISQKGITNLRVAGEVSFSIQLSMAVPHSEAILLSIIQKGLKSITEAERHKIHDKWIQSSQKDILSDWRFWAVVVGALFVICALIIVSFIWNKLLRGQVELRTSELAKEQEALRDSEEKYRALVSNLSSGVVVHSPDSSIIFANPMALSLLGLSKDQIRGKTAIDPAWCFQREDGTRMPHEEFPVNQVISSGMPLFDFVLGICRPDLFNPVWVICNAYPVSDTEGRLQQIVVTFSDISKLKRAEDAVNKKLVALTQPLENVTISFDELFNVDDLQRLQDEFANATHVASIITTTDGTPITRPSNFTRLCGEMIRTSEKGLANCRRSDAILGRYNPDGPNIQPCLSCGLFDAGAGIAIGGHHVANWLIGQVRDETQSEESMRAYAREIGVDESDFIAAFHEVPSMSRTHFGQIANALFTFAHQLSTAAYQNIQQARFINERKKAEQSLQEANEFLKLTLKSSGAGLWNWDFGSNQLTWSPEQYLMFGLCPSLSTPTFEMWRNVVHPDDLSAAELNIKAAVRDHVQLFNEYRIILPLGEVRWINAFGETIYDEFGKPRRMSGICLDITDRKRAHDEKENLESQLHQAQKM